MKESREGNYIYTFLDRVFSYQIIDLFTSYINICTQKKLKLPNTKHRCQPLLLCAFPTLLRFSLPKC